MKWLKQQSEIIISILLGVFFVILGLFILFNTGGIRGEALEVARVETFFDLFNAFFVEVINILGIVIGEFPIIAGLLLILFGAGMFWIARLIRRTTEYDTSLSFFFISLSFVLFLVTTLLMFQVYSWFALFFMLAFIVHMLYSVFNEHLDPRHRKEHYMVILFFYGIAYFFTQNAVYSNIEKTLSPTDVLSIDMFFAIIWILSLMALWVGVFLSKSKNLLKKPKKGDAATLSRQSKRRRLHPDQYLRFSRQLYNVRNGLLQKVKQFMEIEFPTWLKPNYIELLVGTLVLIFILIEFNNRQGVFTEGYFNLSDMQYIYEWVNLFLSLALAVAYLFTTFFNMTQNRYYHRQMIFITALWLKVTVSLYVTVFRDVELSLFILPFNILLVLLTTPLLIISIFKEFDKGRRK
ncbi:lipoteichoic acid stability factor AuxA [Salinicoccus sesuvii]|uniref:Lipoteichoic acid stability factor AuxA n=1 Tax=Salinicoccus sesuvii TaxID=868281 RepID=A0ABV7N5W2_9STAP